MLLSAGGGLQSHRCGGGDWLLHLCVAAGCGRGCGVRALPSALVLISGGAAATIVLQLQGELDVVCERTLLVVVERVV